MGQGVQGQASGAGRQLDMGTIECHYWEAAGSFSMHAISEHACPAASAAARLALWQQQPPHSGALSMQ